MYIVKYSTASRAYEAKKGHFFKVKDVKNLSELLRAVSQNFQSQKDISLKLVRENFTASAIFEKYQRVYEEKLNER